MTSNLSSRLARLEHRIRPAAAPADLADRIARMRAMSDDELQAGVLQLRRDGRYKLAARLEWAIRLRNA